MAAKLGPDVANFMLSFEEAALELYVEIVKREGIDCDLHVTRAFDGFYEPNQAKEARLDFEARVRDHPEAVKQSGLRLTQDLAGQTGLKNGHFSANYPAGHLWPYKLATARMFTPRLFSHARSDDILRLFCI
jgi:hypothetical protein